MDRSLDCEPQPSAQVQRYNKERDENMANMQEMQLKVRHFSPLARISLVGLKIEQLEKLSTQNHMRGSEDVAVSQGDDGSESVVVEADVEIATENEAAENNQGQDESDTADGSESAVVEADVEIATDNEAAESVVVEADVEIATDNEAAENNQGQDESDAAVINVDIMTDNEEVEIGHGEASPTPQDEAASIKYHERCTTPQDDDGSDGTSDSDVTNHKAVEKGKGRANRDEGERNLLPAGRQKFPRPLGGGGPPLNLRSPHPYTRDKFSEASLYSSSSISDDEDDIDVKETLRAMMNEINKIQMMMGEKEVQDAKVSKRRGRFKDVRPANTRNPLRTRLLVSHGTDSPLEK